jgi:hypothetical protein
MTECNKCSKWYHDACVNVISKKYKGKEWVCPICKGERIENIVPKIFRNSSFSTPGNSGSLKGESNNSHTSKSNMHLFCYKITKICFFD